MRGAVVFLVVFAILLVVTLGSPSLPPGRLIYDAIGATEIDYPILGIPVTTLVPAVFNGVIYGFTVWLLYSVASGATRREKREQVIQQTVSVQIEDKEKEARIQEAKREDEKYKSVSIKSIEGIGSIFAEKFAALGIKTSEALLEAGKTRKGRRELAKNAGISPKLVLEWVNLADLIRISGVSEEYSDLLMEAGVDTVAELARRNPEKLHAKVLEINKEKKLVRRLPTTSTIESWVEQAKKLPRIVKH